MSGKKTVDDGRRGGVCADRATRSVDDVEVQGLPLETSGQDRVNIPG